MNIGVVYECVMFVHHLLPKPAWVVTNIIYDQLHENKLHYEDLEENNLFSSAKFEKIQ